MKRYWHMACRFEEGVSKRLVVFFSQNETQRLQLLVIKWGPLFTFTPSIMYFCQDVDTPWQSVCVWAYECWPSYSHAVEYSQLPPFNLRWRKKENKVSHGLCDGSVLLQMKAVEVFLSYSSLLWVPQKKKYCYACAIIHFYVLHVTPEFDWCDFTQNILRDSFHFYIRIWDLVASFTHQLFSFFL